jgi:hypothetical protein
MAAMQLDNACALAGDGKPRLEKMVDSRATTAPLLASVSRTSVEMEMVVMVIPIVETC